MDNYINQIKQEYAFFYDKCLRTINDWLDDNDDTQECRIECLYRTAVTNIATNDVINHFINCGYTFSVEYRTLWEDKDDDYPTFQGYIFTLKVNKRPKINH